MRTFKIIVISALLIIAAAVLLIIIRGAMPTSVGPSDEEFADIYEENEHDLGDDQDLYSQQMKQLEGTVKVLGVSIYGEGTHRLEKDNTLVAILESTDEKVNLQDFIEKEVRVRGFVRDTIEGGQKIMDASYLEVLEESGVKRFSEVSYEFSFSYPGDWDLKKESDKVTFSRQVGDTTDNLMIVYQFKDVNQSLEQWLTDRDQNLSFDETQVKVGSVTGVRRVITNGDEKIVKTYVKEGKNAYEIRLVSQDEVIRNQYYSIVDFFQTTFVGSDEEPQMEPADTVDDSMKLEMTDDEEVMDQEDSMTKEEDTKKEDSMEEATQPEETVKADTTVESEQSFTELEPLSPEEVNQVMEKGFSSFEGRSLSFEYPKVWYFSYLGNGKYGFTDDVTYKANEEQIDESTSRILLIAGSVDVPCAYKQETTLESTRYTVCAREPGLDQISDRVAESIKK
ncbi:MAG: hypothetical protein Q8O95_00990 [bacterium]|nr:hypothetical protein [bacterium]